MKRKGLLFLLVALLPILLFAATGNIAGKVMDKDSGSALSNVMVKIQGTSLVTFTKDNGTFYLKGIPVGKNVISVSILGYKKYVKEIKVEKDITQNLKISLERQALEIQGIKVTETRAVKRETPVAFTNIGEKQISDKYTTEDVPMLLDNVPGLFSSAEGLGDAEITMRGFEADKIQILINGIPVNDPESQKVYWSNWTGLSSNIKSVQVQRGASSSLYGSGAFGGSINIETMGTEAKQTLSLRTSIGGYFMDKTLTADGKGGLFDYDPYNYNVLVKYDTGNLMDGKFNLNAMIERKAGDSYIVGTNYNGYSFGLETQSVLGNHSINASFIGAPQSHNQARKTSDPHLFDTLGRNYNRDNHPYQENYYFKPQFSLRDEWDISDNGVLVTNAFVTKGAGGGKYLYNSTFNVDTGEVGFQPIKTEDNQTIDLGKHARYLYEHYGILMDGYNPSDSTMYNMPTFTAPDGNKKIISAGASLFSSPTAYQYSFRANSRNEHNQFGINSYWQQKFSDQFTIVAGYEFRNWRARHYSKRELFRVNSYAIADSLNDSNDVTTYNDSERRYDYNSNVTNISGFLRSKIKLFDTVNIMADGQYAIYTSKVDENPIDIYDYANGKYTGYSFYMTKDNPKIDPVTNEVIHDENGNVIKKYKDDDYKKVFKFFSPKFGINWNATSSINLMLNGSIAHKEPRVSEWYNRYLGPDASQIYTEVLYDTLDTGEVDTLSVEHFKKLKPETAKTAEIGIGYTSSIFDINLNAYYTKYEDKIASTVDDLGHNLTINAGKAVHKGLEFNTSVKYFNYDANFSATVASNKWQKMNFETIFKIPAEDVIGKHVPYSPEKMANMSAGYTFENMPFNGKLRVGFDTKWWDDYYVGYTNEYEDYYAEAAADSVDVDNNIYYDENGNVIQTIKTAKLPAYFNVGSSLKYSCKIAGKKVSFKLKFDNLFSRADNYSAGYYGKDYNRYKINEDGEREPDALTAKPYMYVTPAPLFNVFFTTEIKF